MRSTFALWCFLLNVAVALSSSAYFKNGGVECDDLAPRKLYGISHEKKNWEEAIQFCKSVADGLATFKNDDEVGALQSMLGK